MLLLILLISVLSVSSESKKHVPSKIACTKLYSYPFKRWSGNCYINQNVMSTTPEMIRNNGYKVESYEVTTSDGYILTLFRIPPADSDNRKGKQPVFMLHGIATDSSVWVDVGNRSLAFQLADQGYDIWLGNNRGTRYSLKHQHYSSSDFDYWNYNWNDLSEHDMRASLQKVANVTDKAGSIIYVGHSRGTALMFMFASEFPKEANQLIKGTIFLCPVAYLDLVWYMQASMRPLLLIAKLLKQFKVSSVFGNIEFTARFLQHFCTVFPYLCRWGINLATGKTNQFLADDLLTYYSNFPLGIAVNELIQIIQYALSGNFQKFDYGTDANVEKYGQERPPQYDLNRFTLPTFFFYGKRDSFLSAKSVTKILKELGSSEKSMVLVPKNVTEEKYQFNHIDFLFSKFVKELFYKDMFLAVEKLTTM
ncbi:hypothetical protein MTP99_002427 [Tenebrio molitor]|nr:hypothetical protein MTP99_002427 [Tenebrio molitor]